MQVTKANLEMSQCEIAGELGVSLGGVNQPIRSVKAGNFKRSRAKISFLYVLTPLGVYEKAFWETAFPD